MTGAEDGADVIGALVGLDETGENVGDRLGEAVGDDVIGARVGAGVFREGLAADVDLTSSLPLFG